MTHRVAAPFLLSFLLAQAFPPQAVSPVGRPTQQTVKIEGCKGQAGCIAVPVDIGGTSVSATTTCHATSAAPTYVDGTDNPVSCDLSGNVRTSGGGGGSGGTVAQGTGAGAASNYWNARLTNGTSFLDPTQIRALSSLTDSVTASITGTVDVSDRSGRLLGHVTVDNASLAVTGTFWPTTAASPSSTRLSTGAAFYDARDRNWTLSSVSDSVNVGNFPSTYDVSDRAARLLGVIYGSQGQQLKQSATNFNTVVELAVGSGLVDPRQIRALTSSDVVDISDRSARLLGHVTVDNASLAVTGTFWQATQPMSSTQLPAALDGSGFFKVHEQGTANVLLQAGTAIAGKFGIDQTTPGTTNGVQVNAALPAGSNVIGKFGIDQTTPGTTNGVQVNAALPAGTNAIGTVQPGNTQNTTAWYTATLDTAPGAGTLSTACADPGSGCTGTAASTLTMAGIVGVGVKIVGSSLVGDQEACDIAYDSVTPVWIPNACAWHDPTTERTFTGKLSALASTTVNYTLIVDSGARAVRIRMAALTSGTATVTFSGTAHWENLSALMMGVPGQTLPPAHATVGGRATTAVPTAGSDGQSVTGMFDKFGRLITAPQGDRALVSQNTVTVSTTTETTLLAAVAATFLDLTYIKCSNTSTTATRVDIRDATAGTVRMTIACPAAVGPCEGEVFQVPWKQTTVNNNWTIQLGTAVTDVRCEAQAIQNK